MTPMFLDSQLAAFWNDRERPSSADSTDSA
jgi:hypothetical protein